MRLLGALGHISKRSPTLFPVHPRTRARMKTLGADVAAMNGVRVLEPLPYLEMLGLVSDAGLVITDSGGLQEETSWLGVPCITLRAETEWVETVDAGWNTLVDADTDAILEATGRTPPSVRPHFYGDGHAADKITAICEAYGG